MVVSETWFNAGCERSIPEFHSYYCSRKLRRGGRVALYIDSSIVCSPQLIETTSDYDFDVVIVKLHLCGKNLYVAVFYRPPNLSFQETRILCDIIRTLVNTDVMLFGDFNFPGMDWVSHSTVVYPKTCEAIEFLELIEDLFLYQHI